MELLRYFHIAPPTPPGVRHTVVDKVRPLIDSLKHAFSSCFSPSQVLVVDEAMIAFKGRDKFKQYIKSKPTRWGYKVWCIAGDGYLLGFNVYTGKSTISSPSTEASIIHQSVISLIQPYYNRGHILYCDNLFTSPVLFNELQRHGVRACGTLRPNRKHLPPDLISSAKELNKGESK